MLVTTAILFVIGYALIAFEHKLKLNKALTASLLGSLLWLNIAIVYGTHDAELELAHIGTEIFHLVAFLLAAMTLVEILIHYKFFDIVRAKLKKAKLTDNKQIVLIAGMAFVISAVIDNLTTAIVMTQIALRFFKGKNILVAVALIVIAANAGGAFSPVGDITTIMLWLAGKFSAFELIAWGFLPSLGLFIVSTLAMKRKIMSDTADSVEPILTKLSISRSERFVIGATFTAFTFPVVFHLLGLEPYLGLLFGLGLVGVIIALLRGQFSKRESHMTVEIESIVRKVDLSSILFFIGILLTVGALKYVGLLELISNQLFGENPDVIRLVFGNTVLGITSAIVDNIPITAAAIDIIASSDPAIWILLALTVGTGGSMLVIGSAAGVIAMGMIKELTFKKYFELAFIPALLGYLTAIAIWAIQYAIFRL